MGQSYADNVYNSWASLVMAEVRHLEETLLPVCFTLGDVRMGLWAEPSILRFASDYFGKFFTECAVVRGDGGVLVSHNDRLLAELKTEPYRCKLDHRQPRRIGSADMSSGPATFVLLPHGNRILLCLPRGAQDIDIVVMRAIRSTIIRGIQESGCRFLHASAVSRGPKCVLIAGDKFAGKTTTMTQLLLRGCDFLSNDKVAVSVVGTKLRAQGFPIAAGIRRGTCLWLAERGYSHLHELATAQRDVFVAPPSEEFNPDDARIRVHPEDLARAFGVGIAGECEIACIVVQSFTPEGPAGIRRLDSRSIKVALERMWLNDWSAILPEHDFMSALEPTNTTVGDRHSGKWPTNVPVYQVGQSLLDGSLSADLVMGIIDK